MGGSALTSGLTFIVAGERPAGVANKIARCVLADVTLEMSVVDEQLCRFASQDGMTCFEVILREDTYGTLVEIDGIVDKKLPFTVARSLGGVLAPPPVRSSSPMPGGNAASGDTRIVPAISSTQPVATIERALQLVLDSGIVITLDTRVIIGRDPATVSDPSHREVRHVRVVDPESAVSKSHLAAETRDGQVWIEDLASTNGTRVQAPDGSTMTLMPHKPVPVGAGATVFFGSRRASVSTG